MISPTPIPPQESLSLLENIFSLLFPEFNYKLKGRIRDRSRSRMDKAIKLVRDDLENNQCHIQEVGPVEYRVQSATSQGRFHLVAISPEVGHDHTCTCWDSGSKTLCYHILAVTLKIAICRLYSIPFLSVRSQSATTPTAGRRPRKTSSQKPAPVAPPTPAHHPGNINFFPILEAPSGRRISQNAIDRWNDQQDDEIPF
jgi:hypothetical protein